jgi:hypothetical protein
MARGERGLHKLASCAAIELHTDASVNAFVRFLGFCLEGGSVT